jgi:hypothetical protein
MLAKHWSEEIPLLGETVRDNTAIEPSCAHRCGPARRRCAMRRADA